MNRSAIDTAIIGAGPYGLSLAAYLNQRGRAPRVFGSPMRFWSHHMPQGMQLKSEGFASNLYEPSEEFTLRRYCTEMGLPYEDIGLPVEKDVFVAYALEFQKRFVPQLEDVLVTSVRQDGDAFELRTSAGETLRARNVVVAAGIMNYAHLPPSLAGLPPDVVTHTSDHSDLHRFKGRRIAVLGAGASAVDMAALVREQGASVDLLARRRTLAFHERPVEPRPLWQRIKAPRSGLGIGWRSRLCTDMPLVFHAMPEKLRMRAVERHLGPAPCWFTKDSVQDKVRMHLDAHLESVTAEGGHVRLVWRDGSSQRHELEVDHVIAGTGFKVALGRLGFLDERLVQRIRRVSDTPVLGRHFDSSVPGLFFVGATAANSFGPMLRFAYGARFAARRVAQRLAH